MIKSNCPACGNEYTAADSYAGLRARCNKCDAKIVVSDLTLPPPASADEMQLAAAELQQSNTELRCPSCACDDTKSVASVWRQGVSQTSGGMIGGAIDDDSIVPFGALTSSQTQTAMAAGLAPPDPDAFRDGREYGRQYQAWLKLWVCMRCGRVFTPPEY